MLFIAFSIGVCMLGCPPQVNKKKNALGVEEEIEEIVEEMIELEVESKRF